MWRHAITEAVARSLREWLWLQGYAWQHQRSSCGSSYGKLLQPVDCVHLYVAWSPGSDSSCTGATYALGLCWISRPLQQALRLCLTQPPQRDWYFDTGATSHMASDTGILSSFSPPPAHSPSSIVVGNGNLLPVTATGTTHLPYNFNLNNVLVSPNLIKNLVSVRRFTTDNNCSVEFDPFGCSIKDFPTRSELVRCNSSGPLYPLQLPASEFLAAISSTLWHQRLGHPGRKALSRLASTSAISCNKGSCNTLCHACQLGRHVRLPFQTSSSCATHSFQLIHCDLWTSPITSVSGHQYYLVIVDDFSHYVWTFPLCKKSDTFPTLSDFFAYVRTQFGVTV